MVPHREGRHRESSFVWILYAEPIGEKRVQGKMQQAERPTKMVSPAPMGSERYASRKGVAE